MNLSRLLVATLLTFSFSLASAGTASGLVTKYFSYEDTPTNPSMFFVYLNAPATNPASCAAGDRWVIRTDTLVGITHMAVVMKAKQLGRPVMIYGKGEAPSVFPNACDVYPGTESVRTVVMSD